MDKLKFPLSQFNRDMIGGIRIIESINAVEAVEEKIEVSRSWWERWFSRPWQPFKMTKTQTKIVYKPASYQMMGRLIVHPAISQKLREELKNRENQT